MYGLGMESNWNSFKIYSDQFENLRFNWFEKAKNIQQIDENQFEFNLFDLTPTKYSLESNYQKLNSFEIHLIWFENFQFHWIEMWKIFRKIRWKSIRNSLIQIHL